MCIRCVCLVISGFGAADTGLGELVFCFCAVVNNSLLPSLKGLKAVTIRFDGGGSNFALENCSVLVGELFPPEKLQLL